MIQRHPFLNFAFSRQSQFKPVPSAPVSNQNLSLTVVANKKGTDSPTATLRSDSINLLQKSRGFLKKKQMLKLASRRTSKTGM